MKDTLVRMTYILEVELGPQDSPSHFAYYDLVSEQQRCVRHPNRGSWFWPRKVMFLSSVPSTHTHT